MELKPSASSYISMATTIGELEQEVRAKALMPENGPIFCKDGERWRYLTEGVGLPNDIPLQIKVVNATNYNSEPFYSIAQAMILCVLLGEAKVHVYNVSRQNHVCLSCNSFSPCFSRNVYNREEFRSFVILLIYWTSAFPYKSSVV